MELKKSLTKTFLIFLLTLISINVYSSNIDDCASNIEGFVDQIEKNENIKLFLDDLKNSEKLDSSIRCTAESFVETLPSKVLYLIFGDVTKETFAWSLALTGNEANIENSFNQLKDNFNGFSSISIVFTSITTIIMMIASLILIFQAFKVFNGSAKDLEFLGKNTNKSWTLIKLSIGFSLIVPIVNGYSFAQVLVLIAASIGTFVANLFWLILMTIINLIMSVNYQSFINDSDLKDGSINKLTSNIIEMQICDIEKRNIFFEINKQSDIISLNDHNESEFSKCLSKEYEINSNKDIFEPKELIKTNYCIDKVFKEKYKSCGSLNVKIDEKENIENILNKSRNIAEKIYSLPCQNKDIEKKYSKPYQYGYVCAEIKDSDYSFIDGKIKYIDKNENIQEKFKEIKNDIENLKKEIEGVGNKLIIDNLNESDISDKKDKIKRGISNGWYSASHFLNDSTNTIKKTMSIINQSWELINANSNLDGNIVILEEKDIDENNILLSFNQSLRDVWEKTNEKEGNILYTLGIKNFFKGIFSLNSFLGISDNNIIEEIKKEDSCFKNFSNCQEASLNPLYDYIKMGNDILEKSSIVVLTTEGASFALKIMKKNSALNEISGIYGAGVFVLGIIISLLKIYFAIGLLIVYGTPFIPFLYFLSYIISWNILVIEGVITAQIWAMLHLLISKKEGFSENVQIGYNLMFTIALQPIILVIAMVISLIATSIAIGIFNVLFGILMSSLPLSATPSTIMEFVFTIIAYLIYAILLTVVILKITKIIFEIPDSLTQTLRLTQMPAGGAHGWSEVMQRMNTILNVKVLNALRI